MKKIIALVICLQALTVKSQNLQLHYDFGSDRKFYTATFEMFRPYTLGSTFWFIDLDFDFPGSPRSMSAAYMELSRDFYIPFLRKKPLFDQLTFHIEYNDGFGSDKALNAFTFNNAFLTGFGHPVKIGKVTVSTFWLVRIPRATSSADFQFTLAWLQPVFNGKVIITGFADFWSQDSFDKSKKDFLFQTEPQFWYMFTPKLGVGSELEINRNFPTGTEPWKVRPTLALRWDF